MKKFTILEGMSEINLLIDSKKRKVFNLDEIVFSDEIPVENLDIGILIYDQDVFLSHIYENNSFVVEVSIPQDAKEIIIDNGISIVDKCDLEYIVGDFDAGFFDMCTKPSWYGLSIVPTKDQIISLSRYAKDVLDEILFYNISEYATLNWYAPDETREIVTYLIELNFPKDNSRILDVKQEEVIQ